MDNEYVIVAIAKKKWDGQFCFTTSKFYDGVDQQFSPGKYRIKIQVHTENVGYIEQEFFLLKGTEWDDLALEPIGQQRTYPHKSPYSIAKDFVDRYLRIGLEESRTQQRAELLRSMKEISKPHEKLLNALDLLLQKIQKTHQLTLHGPKEHSGSDLIKTVSEADIGFQLKSANDDLSEKALRYHVSKAREYHLAGFVYVYGRPTSAKVKADIQAAYHYFRRENKREEIYCSVLEPEVFAELLLNYEVDMKRILK